jgi:tetratricopeptide (TPR) repeat protein
VYLGCFLNESVRCAQQTNSLPDLIRFGSLYFDYRKKACGQLDQFETLLESKKFSQAFKIAETLSEQTDQTACLATMGCWAVHNQCRDLLTNVVDHIEAKSQRDFGPFNPIACALIGHLIHLGEKDLLVRLLSVFSEGDFKEFLDAYFCTVLEACPDLPHKFNTIIPLLNKIALCNPSRVGNSVGVLARILFEKCGKSGDNDNLAEQLVVFARSLRDPEAKTKVSQILADSFIKNNLHSHALEATKIILGQLTRTDPSTFLSAVGTVLETLRLIKPKRDSMCLYKLLLTVMEAYEPAYVFYKAEALADLARHLREVTLSSYGKKLSDGVSVALSRLRHPLFRDYVRVQLIAVAARHKAYADAAQELKSVTDPLCREWAAALILGQALASGCETPPAMEKVMQEFGQDGPLSAHLLFRLGRRILRFAKKPILAPMDIQYGERAQMEETGYPRFCALAIADIASAVNKTNATSRDIKALSNLLQQAVQSAVSEKSEWGWLACDAMVALLSEALQINHPKTRQRVLSAMLRDVASLEPYYRYIFLCHLATGLVHTGDKELFHEVVDSLPDLVEKNHLIDRALDAVLAVSGELTSTQKQSLMQRLLDHVAEPDNSWRGHDLATFISTAVKVLEGAELVDLLSQVANVCEKDRYPKIPENVFITLAGAYAGLELWQKARRHAEDPDNHYSVRVHILSHLGYILDSKRRFQEAREFFRAALKESLQANQRWAVQRIHASLAPSFGRLQKFRPAFDELRRIHKQSERAMALVKVCRFCNPSEKGSSEFESEVSLIDEVRSNLTDPQDQIMALAAKARFLEKAGLKEESRQSIAEALDILADKADKAGKIDAIELVWAARSLRDLLVESDDDQWMRTWLDVAVVFFDRFSDPGVLDDIAAVMPSSAAENKKWLVSELIDILNRRPKSRPLTWLVECLSSLFRSIKDEKTAIEYWGQLIAALSRMDIVSNYEFPSKHLCVCLADSGVGDAKVYLLGKLCSAMWSALRPPRADNDAQGDVRGIVQTVLANPGFEDKGAALKAILASLPVSPMYPWIPAIVAEGFISLGEREKANSLFKNAMDLTDRIEEDYIAGLEKSEIALIMARCGFLAEVRPLFERLIEAHGLLSDRIKANAALGLVLCDGPRATMSVAQESGSEEAAVIVAAELLARKIQGLTAVRSPSDSSEIHENKHPADDEMEMEPQDANEHLAVIQEAPDSVARDTCLKSIANETRKLPPKQAIRWLAKLPTFFGEDEAWQAICARCEYDPNIVQQVLDMVPRPKTKSDLIREISGLSGSMIDERLRLLLCAQAVFDRYLFFNVACDCLQHCSDAEVLEEVKLEIDEIEASFPAGPIKEGSRPAPKVQRVPEQEGRRVKIEFASTGVTVDGMQIERITAEWRMLEYFLWKKKPVHWLEGYLIFPRWRAKKEGVTDGRNLFRQRKDGCERILKEYGLELEFKGDRKENAACWELVKHNLSTNIQDADGYCRKAEELFKNGNLPAARVEVDRALKIYPNHLESHLLVAKCCEHQGFGNVSAGEVREVLLPSWQCLKDRGDALNYIGRIYSGEEDKDVRVFLSELQNSLIHLELRQRAMVLGAWLDKRKLTDDEVILAEINTILNGIVSTKNTALMGEQIEAFCRIECVNDVILSMWPIGLRLATALLIPESEEGLATKRLEAMAKRAFKSVKDFKRYLRNNFISLAKAMQAKGTLSQKLSESDDFRKIVRQIQQIDQVEEKLCQKLSRQNIGDDQLVEEIQANYDWGIEHIRYLLQVRKRPGRFSEDMLFTRDEGEDQDNEHVI